MMRPELAAAVADCLGAVAGHLVGVGELLRRLQLHRRPQKTGAHGAIGMGLGSWTGNGAD